jgi:hypothetical protein
MKLVLAALVVGAAESRRGQVSVTATDPSAPEDTKQTVKAPKGPMMNLGGTIETRLGDQLTVGGEYDQRDGQFRPKSLYATWNVPTKSRNPLVVRGVYSFVAEEERRGFFSSLLKVLSAPFTFLFGSR